MAKSGFTVWQDRFVTWKHSKVASPKDLTYQPHFVVDVYDRDKKHDKRVHFDNVQVKGDELRKVEDLMQLPQKEREGILNSAVYAWELEFGKARHLKGLK